jgi:hypothetical protein
MSAPQTKERPASMLRAMFASLGSLLGVKDKARAKPAAPATEAAAEPAAPAEPEAAVAETVAVEAAEVDPVQDEVVPAEPEIVAVEVVAVETVAAPPETVAEPEVVVAEAVEVEPVATVAVETVAVPPEAGSALPVANYDELSVASLRARLRSLSVGQLTELVEYEKAHAARADVITMFERRIVKVQAES